MHPIGEPLLVTAGRESGQAARRTVRERAAKVLADAEALDDVELMAAEAIANAVLHGSGLIRVAVRGGDRRVRVEVRDGGPTPREEGAHHRLDHGRGLAVIDALAAEWGLEQSPDETNLWFTVEAPAP
ncbi:ATP-binding protein [Actinomadura sp. PM05-2]|uniref:ATP-binding protein n=1 Tax=Actinomadura parmotrematis TaxID=2864039 RepID=A0ABS7FRG8_9ACTN|nr:ATP-binding protein [Actinomadura parmotrematis]